MRRLLLLSLPAFAAALLALSSVTSAGPSSTAPAAGGTGAVTTGSGKAASELRTVDEFDSIKLHGPLALELRVGPKMQVQIHGDDNLLRYVTTKVKKRTLTIEIEARPKESLRPRTTLRAVITTPSLAGLAVRGPGEASLSGAFAGSLSLAVQGPGTIRASGSAKSIQAAVQGPGEILAKDLVTESGTVAVQGTGEIQVHTSASITAAISGTGDVHVYGKPANVSRIVDGMGSVEIH